MPRFSAANPFRYPGSLDEARGGDYFQRQLEQVHELHGRGEQGLSALFPGGDTGRAPWPMATRMKGRMPFDKQRVHSAVAGRQATESFDPRNLHKNQQGIQRPGVEYYMSDEYNQTGRTFADQDQGGNRFPVVYAREDGRNLLLAGHHRASASLLQGKQFQARVVEGPWG